jgi:3-hydroxyisobutyrate dehydrogenase-like beta-hydroxyacid dehydrogenase
MAASERPERIGFLGVGTMGLPMAENIMAAGFQLTVFDLDPEPLALLDEKGARVAASVAELARAVDIVEVAVAPPPALEAVAFGPDGVVENARPGTVLDIHSTADPEVFRAIAEAGASRGVGVLDAQMTGGDRGAKAGALTFMVGGDPALLERCRPVLDACGKEIYHVGGVGTGSLAKIAHNAIIAMIMAANAEGFAFAERAGVDPEVFQEIIRHGSAKSHVGDDWLERWSRAAPTQYEWIMKSILEVAPKLGLELPTARLTHQLNEAAAIGTERGVAH